MGPPVRPDDFKALIAKPEDSLGRQIVNTYVKLPCLVYKLIKYMVNPLTLQISDQFCADLGTIQCPAPVTEEEEE